MLIGSFNDNAEAQDFDPEHELIMDKSLSAFKAGHRLAAQVARYCDFLKIRDRPGALFNTGQNDKVAEVLSGPGWRPAGTSQERIATTQQTLGNDSWG